MNLTPPMPLRRLLDQLERYGATVAGADRYRTLTAVRATPPARPARLLDLTPAQLLDHAQALAAARENAPRVAKALADLRPTLDAELRTELRAHVVDHLRAITPAFTTAADAARKLRKAGVQPDDTADALLARRADPRTLTAWHTFTTTHAPTLDDIAAIAAAVVAHDLIDSLKPDADPTVLLLRPYSRDTWPAVTGATATRWLEHAERLRLILPTELGTPVITAANRKAPEE